MFLDKLVQCKAPTEDGGKDGEQRLWNLLSLMKLLRWRRKEEKRRRKQKEGKCYSSFLLKFVMLF
jgi:hypothetical protein